MSEEVPTEEPTEEELDEARRKYSEALVVFRRADPDPPSRRLGRHVGKVLCEAFGIDPNTVCRIELDCSVNEAAILTVTNYASATDAALATLGDSLTRYELRQIEQ